MQWGHMLTCKRAPGYETAGHVVSGMRTYLIMYEETCYKTLCQKPFRHVSSCLPSMCPHGKNLEDTSSKTCGGKHKDKACEVHFLSPRWFDVEVTRQKHTSSCNFSAWLPPYGWSMCPHAFFACGQRIPVGMHSSCWAVSVLWLGIVVDKKPPVQVWNKWIAKPKDSWLTP